MARQEGYVLIIDPEAPTIERDTCLCRHCQRIVEIKPGTMGQVYLIPDEQSPTHYREESGAFCGSCFGPICLSCERKEASGAMCERGSNHWERQMEKHEALAREAVKRILGRC